MTKFIGIDLGHSCIKVAFISNTKKGPYIENLQSYKRSLDPNVDPELELIEILKKIKEQTKEIKYQVALSIDQSKIAYRYKIFPFSEKTKIIKALPFELEEDLPFPIENAYWDARIIKYIGTNTHILTASTPQNNVEKIMNSIQSLDLNITKLTSPALALYNVTSYLGRLPPKFINADQTEELKTKDLKLVLDIGSHQTIVNLYNDDLFINSSVILWGAQKVIQAISKRYEIDVVEAEKILTEKGFVLIQKGNANYDQIVFSQTISDSIKNLAQELQLLIINFESVFQGTIKEVLITGGFSRLIHIAPHLTQQIEKPVNHLNYFNRWNIDPHLNHQEAPYFVVAIGLALELLKKNNEPTLQFLQGPFARKNQDLQKFFEKNKDLLIWSAVLFFTFLSWTYIRSSLSYMLVEKIDTKVEMAGQNIANLNKKQSKPGPIKNHIKLSRNVIKDRQSFVSIITTPNAFYILNKISEVFPSSKSSPKPYVTEIKISGFSVEIHGTVNSQTEKLQLIDAIKKLSKNGKIKEITPSSSNQFSMQFEFKGS